ncbi:GNAT family N-acetyltransferase [Oenococcus oeni]|uniref:GNAT family N-acetyltransferase n=1 Tax=Oenococcus oeni TaxID=1247 RepID=UPI001EF9D6EA|nr:GNAT family N-acetyltransferase [Oenococcus oeni]
MLKLGFSSYSLNKISASFVPNNIGSKKVLKKLVCIMLVLLKELSTKRNCF